MSLPNPSMSFSPFAILTAEELNDIVENIEALSNGSGLNSNSIATANLKNSSVTGEKISSYLIKRQDNTTNSVEKAGKILTGAGVISGGPGKNVTFSEPFTSIPIVLITNVGGNASSAAYAYPSVGGGGGTFTDRVLTAVNQSITGFRAMTNGAAPTASQGITFTWAALGD